MLNTIKSAISSFASPCEALSHAEREGAVVGEQIRSTAALETKLSEWDVAAKRARADSENAIAASRAKADARRAALSSALATEVRTTLADIVEGFDTNPREAASSLIAAWRKFTARSNHELGAPVGHAHLQVAFRKEAGREHCYRNPASQSPVDDLGFRQNGLTQLSAFAGVLEGGDRVLVADAAHSLRVAMRARPDGLEVVEPLRTAAIVSAVTETDQRRALADELAARRDRKATAEEQLSLAPARREPAPIEAQRAQAEFSATLDAARRIGDKPPGDAAA